MRVLICVLMAYLILLADPHAEVMDRRDDVIEPDYCYTTSLLIASFGLREHHTLPTAAERHAVNRRLVTYCNVYGKAGDRLFVAWRITGTNNDLSRVGRSISMSNGVSMSYNIDLPWEQSMFLLQQSGGHNCSPVSHHCAFAMSTMPMMERDCDPCAIYLIVAPGSRGLQSYWTARRKAKRACRKRCNRRQQALANSATYPQLIIEGHGRTYLEVRNLDYQ